MRKNNTVTNEHQKYILSQLKTRRYARFKDLLPPTISSNSASYHLNQLLKGGWIVRANAGYSLGPAGLAFAERDVELKSVRMQPNVLVVFVIQDGYGNVLLHKKAEQPYIEQWELPSAHVAVADVSVRESAVWAAKKLLHYVPNTLRHVGDCYVRVHKGKLALSSTLAHVIRFSVDDYKPMDGYAWLGPLSIGGIPHTPGVEQIITRSFFNDDFFFEEFTVQLAAQESFGI